MSRKWFMRYCAVVTGALASIGLDALVAHQHEVAIGEFVCAAIFIALAHIMARETYDKETRQGNGNP